MKGFIAKSLTSTALAAGLAATTGCHHEYAKCVDHCYPERYCYASRQATMAAFAPQVQNGDILYHTMWNYYFDAGKEDLNPSGRDHLDGLVRRRPYPSERIYLATARDIPYDSNNPERYAEVRRELDDRRSSAIQRYLSAQTAGRPMNFEIVIHDPAEVGQFAHPANRSILLNQNSTMGSIAVSSSASTAGQGQGGSGGGMGGGSSGGSGAPSGGSGGGSSGGGR